MPEIQKRKVPSKLPSKINGYKYHLVYGKYHFRGISEAERALQLQPNCLRARYDRAPEGVTPQQVLDEVIKEMTSNDVFYLNGEWRCLYEMNRRGRYITHRELAKTLGVAETFLREKIKREGSAKKAVAAIRVVPMFETSTGIRTRDRAALAKIENVEYYFLCHALDSGLDYREAIYLIRNGEYWVLVKGTKVNNLQDYLDIVGCTLRTLKWYLAQSDDVVDGMEQCEKNFGHRKSLYSKRGDVSCGAV